MMPTVARHLRVHRPGLQGRFMLGFTLMVVTLMTGVVFVVEHRMSSVLMEEAEMRATAIARSIAATVKSELLSYDYVALQQAAETATHDENLLYVIILTKEDVVAGYSGHADLQGQALPAAELVSQAASMQMRRLVEGEDPAVHVEHLDIGVPVTVEGTPVQWGTVRVGMSLSSLQTALAHMRLLLGILGLCAVCITLVSVRFLSRQIILPIAGLADATAIIRAGDLDHSVDENMVGELGDLALGFNAMTAELRRSRDAIKNHNLHLENMVQQRTAALAQKARELEQVNTELKELDRLKSDFLSNVSHELRTPLTAIRSFTEILLDPEPDVSDVERREFLQIVSSQAERLTRLISDLLDLSKIEAGKFECRVAPLEVAKIVDTCVHSLRSLASSKSVELLNAIPPSLPLVSADVDRMSQVLTNLIDNAVKFTRSGGAVTVTAHVGRRRRCVVGVEREGSLPRGAFNGMESRLPEHGQYVIVSVRDTGIGIAAADEQRVFDKFGQVGNILTEKPQGTGLGLPISGSIAVQHGGALWVESTPGMGSVFSVSIPVAAVESTLNADGVAVDANPGGTAATAAPGAGTGRDPQPKTAALPAAPSASRLATPAAAGGSKPPAGAESLVGALRRSTVGKRILVVDDEPSIVAALTELLQPAGFQAIGCQTGSQAVAKARELRPDAIVLDIMMPEINGFDVLRLLKSEPSTAQIPVIVLSVLDERDKAMALGASEYVRKPFEKNVLLDNVRMLV